MVRDGTCLGARAELLVIQEDLLLQYITDILYLSSFSPQLWTKDNFHASHLQV